MNRFIQQISIVRPKVTEVSSVKICLFLSVSKFEYVCLLTTVLNQMV